MGPSPTKRPVKVTSGSLPSPKIHTLAACHPFSQQLDIILPALVDSHLCAALEGLETGYGKAKARLSEVIEGAREFVDDGSLQSKLLAMSANQHSDDAWCVDPRGHLTLSVAKETYARLGLVGKPLPFKGHEDRHTIDIPLHKNAQSPTVQARVKAAVEIWDRGLPNELGGGEAGLWDVVYCWNDRETPQTIPFQDGQWHRVQCTKNELQSVHVPVPSLSPQPSSSKSRQSRKNAEEDADSVDEWNRRTQSLFEWVGMACLGAQRLNANDRVDPYVALYTPPSPSRVGNVTHLRWRGLLSPSFIQDVLNTVMQSLQSNSSTSNDPSNIPNFVSVTVHALTSAPVSYLPYTQSTTDGGALQPPLSGKVPLKASNAAGEDTWSLVVERQSDGLKWCLAESVGPGDARWG